MDKPKFVPFVAPPVDPLISDYENARKLSLRFQEWVNAWAAAQSQPPPRPQHEDRLS